jgi:hypothetical protein
MAASLCAAPVWPAEPPEAQNPACENIARTVAQAQQRADQLVEAQQQRVGDNAVVVGTAFIFWPALLALRMDPAQARELKALQAQITSLLQDADAQQCGDVQRLSAAEQSTLPIAVGDVFVYSERVGTALPRTLRLRVQRLERRQFIFEWSSDAGSGTWVQDRAGNVLGLPQGPHVYWRHLLPSELQPGRRWPGEVNNLNNGTAQLRAEFVAEHVKTPFGTRFDPVVLDLRGEVDPGTPPPKVEGAMVVDRRSGLLLRLELHGEDPQFDLERRLVHIEPAPR